MKRELSVVIRLALQVWILSMEKKLISQVFEHDFLYAVDSVHYRDRHMRVVAWAEIGKELGLPGKVLFDFSVWGWSLVMCRFCGGDLLQPIVEA